VRILTGLAAALAALAPGPAGRERPPNIILILADDFGYECVRANGGTSYTTPNLDGLAASGMRFERCFAQPLCTPTRIQIMTGIYNVRNYTRFGAFPPGETTFAQLFKAAGYATGIAGKWQLGREPDLPRRLGFDEAFLWQHTRRPPRYANPGLEIDGVEKDFTNGEYGPDLVNAFALDFIARHKDRPFLLYYPMLLTHDPFQPTPDSLDWDPKARGEKSNRHPKYFADMVAYLDKLVGRVVRRLEELGLREKTLVIFTGDNGTSPAITSTLNGAPYRGGKGATTAAGMHVPLIASWPGVIPPGRVCGDLVDSTDFFPTICAAAGVPLPPKATIDGRSFLPQLRGEPGEPREWIYCWYSREGSPQGLREFAATARYKLYRDGHFFDLANDPGEQSPLPAGSLKGEAAGAAGRLREVLDRFAAARPERLRRPGGTKESP